ncbi:hypothetical protein CAC42_784 [Sphaceloma murrayae]|uniref:Uncharacterized protein n=1 Tax=Sphaceloma murrayae TaxID=2082308 RepID=A0A2K1QK32_9PEZI|nr:hypothetical protein CAC42_784 [Sphaceloma murrayae]
MAKQNMTWNAEADRALFMAIIETGNFQIDYEAVAGKLASDTVACSVIAVKRRMQKLKEMCGVKGPVKSGKRAAEAEVQDGTDAKGGKKRSRATTKVKTVKEEEDEDQDEAGAEENLQGIE